MYFRGGSANYTAENAGIESLALSGTIECGTGKYAAGEFNDQVDEYGLHLDGAASNDYGLVKLKCISRYTDEAWKLFSSAIASPEFETQKFDLLKEQKISELNVALSNPDNRLSQLAKEFAFAGTPYAINPDGTVATLTALNRKSVKEYYYNILLNKSRMFLLVAGNISRESLEAKVKAAFSEIPDKPYTPAVNANQFFAEDIYKIESRSIATNYVCGLVNAPGLNSPDYPAYRLAVTILHSSLYDAIRLTRHLSYAPAAFVSAGKIPYTTMYASTSQPRETVQTMRAVLSHIKSKTYPGRVVEDVKKILLLSYQKEQEIMSDVADELGKAEIMGNWKLAENLDTRIETVSADDVKEVLSRYINKIVWAYIGDPVLGKQSFN
jgi:predicted Zn-dependent peptidase